MHFSINFSPPKRSKLSETTPQLTQTAIVPQHEKCNLINKNHHLSTRVSDKNNESHNVNELK